MTVCSWATTVRHEDSVTLFGLGLKVEMKNDLENGVVWTNQPEKAHWSSVLRFTLQNASVQVRHHVTRW